MRKFKFVEPHITGGAATIIITEEEILKYMRSLGVYDHLGATDEELIYEFTVVNWAVEIKDSETVD